MAAERRLLEALVLLGGRRLVQVTASSGPRRLLLTHLSLLDSAAPLGLVGAVRSGIEGCLAPLGRAGSELLAGTVAISVAVGSDRRTGGLGASPSIVLFVSGGGATALDRDCLAILGCRRGSGQKLATGLDALSCPVAPMIMIARRGIQTGACGTASIRGRMVSCTCCDAQPGPILNYFDMRLAV